jgi:CheY-like chemotaxis protein
LRVHESAIVTIAFRFLVVDDSREGFTLIERTLHRKFPSADVIEAADAGDALNMAAMCKFDVIVVRKASAFDTQELVRLLRTVVADTPMLVLADRATPSAEFIGATKVLAYDEWLMAGPPVDELLLTAR